ncbi:uncharacterized protein LOC121113300 isoform X2 [Gallus gallus]|uniref:uncharacterized protein LOC121113300 isoform X2 n=1 Tax=Gallus gallus TaxID=9031 RepID=UPI001F013CF9|nr:uncharacterized protein LOC121113300 isoform X2 [Gallus gallus]
MQLLREKEITPCSGNFSHLFLILDDELRAPFPGDPLDPDSVRVPVGQPRGPAGESAEWNPVYEPEGDAGDVPGGGDPGSPLGSGTESPADHMGPEEGKDESKRVEYSQGSSHLLNDLLKEMENAARGTDQQNCTGRAAGRQPSHAASLGQRNADSANDWHARDECWEKHKGCCSQICAKAPHRSDGTVLSCAAVCTVVGLWCCVMDVQKIPSVQERRKSSRTSSS